MPTSVGYGASFGGITALLAMLNSCASGVSVVNIDNGFGAAAVASAINHLPSTGCQETPADVVSVVRVERVAGRQLMLSPQVRPEL